jgi:Flp pilus assembly protein TadB/Mg-chelatase subunit ChlD
VRRLVLCVLALALALPSAALAAVRISVDATAYPNVRVTVVTAKATRRPPTVEENGKPVELSGAPVNFGRAKSVVLAIDSSQSMRGKPLQQALAAAQAFADAKPAADEISVSSFASQVGAPTPFSASTTDADVALRTITVDRVQGTKLFDEVVADANSLAAHGLPGRVIIMVTDGNETDSKATLDDAIAAAHAARASVYVVGIESRLFTPGPLRRLAEQTGGRYYAAASAGYLRSVYAAIADELSRTWQITYVTAVRPGQHLAVSASVPGQGSASTSIAISGQNTVTTSKPSLPKAMFSTAGTVVLGLVVGLIVLLAIRALFLKSRTEEMRRRIQPHVAQEPTKVKRVKRERVSALKRLFVATEHVLGKTKQWSSLSNLLERADVPLKTVEFAYVILGSGLALGIMLALAGLGGVALFFGFVFGALIPAGVIWRKARRRLSAFDEQLPDLLMAVAASLKAGHSFKQAIQTLVDEAQDPAKKEFQRVLAETSLGRPIEEALADMADRLGSKNFSFIVTAVTIQNQVGGSLSGLFDMVADTVRQRQGFARKIRALTAMGRASAYVLIALPIFLGALMTLINRKYMSPLFTTSSGHMLIIVGIVMMTIGSLILRKIVGFKG